MIKIVLLGYFLHAVSCVNNESRQRPHIIYILADDLGWNDVGFHGSNQIPTPNIDALAFSGIILNNYYVTPICTPSRSALMTGKYPIHTGMQHAVLYGAEPRGLPLSEKLLPQYLKELGYSTHLVGKWHLGSYKRVYTPLYRGFDSHVGFWTGRIDYFDHTSQEFGTWGFDFRKGMDVAYDLFGKYATDVYTEEAVKIIMKHNTSTPLYLMVGHSAVHSGNPYSPLPAPDSSVARFHNIEDYPRQRFAGMLTELDKSVGEVVAALQKHGLLQDSIIVFSTDNGGPAAGFNNNAASNYPLRGVKNTLWEGGVRGAALVWSADLSEKSRVSDQMMHIADWLPTLYTAAGGDSKTMKDIDGIDMWESLTNNSPSERCSVLHNIDDIYGSAALTVDHWKLHKGTNYGGQWDSWYGPSGEDGDYDLDALYKNKAGVAINKLKLMPDQTTITQLRDRATLRCSSNVESVTCEPLEAPCLFNVKDDPCERINLADKEPDILQKLLTLLEKFNKTSIPPSNVPVSPRGDPALWDHVYTNFGDYQDSIVTTLAPNTI